MAGLFGVLALDPGGGWSLRRNGLRRGAADQRNRSAHGAGREPVEHDPAGAARRVPADRDRAADWHPGLDRLRSSDRGPPLSGEGLGSRRSWWIDRHARSVRPCGKHSSRTARGFGESSTGAADRVTHFTRFQALFGDGRNFPNEWARTPALTRERGFYL